MRPDRSVHVRAVLRMLPTTQCVPWPGKLTKAGYGHISSRFTHKAHRYVWIIFNGVPLLPELDHLCRNPRCVNPAHLEPVTHAENHRRRAAAMTECRRGHEFNEANTYYRADGRRQCRICARRLDALRYQRDPGRRQRQREERRAA